jgi:putative DNA primase/helicase
MMTPTTAADLATRRNGHSLDGAEWRARTVERPTIAVTGDLADAARLTWSAIEAANTPPFLFLYGGLPVRLERDDAGALVARSLTFHRMRYVMARVAAYTEGVRRPREVFPPAAVVNDVLAAPQPSLPKLTGIVEVPALTKAGTIRAVPGYDAEAGIAYEPPPGFILPAVPAHPTPAERMAALTLLASDLLGDFPFTSLVERTHALGLLLLPFLRECIDGPTPLHVIDKPMPGTGATLLVTALLIPALGRAVPLTTQGRDEEETRKRLTSKLAAGAPVMVLDNLHGRLDSAALSAALTATTWEDRILGRSETVTLPVRAVWAATSNNASLSLELARRAVRIRLDAGCEMPWQRTAFAHPDLVGWALAHRGELVAAALTLCRAWVDAGRPKGPRRLGMFEQWSDCIGGVLAVAGLDGFLANAEDLYASADLEGQEHRAFISAWWAAHAETRCTAAELVQLEALPTHVVDGKDTGRTRRLGNLLAALRDRCFQVLDGETRRTLRLEYAGDQRRAALWRLRVTDG